MHATGRILIAALFVACLAATASAQVTINEVKFKSTEFVELHNAGGADVDVTGWTLDDGSGPEALAVVVPAGGFVSIATALPLSNSGGVMELRDATGALVDDMGWGNGGGAPLGFNSTGRSPDGDDTDDWARDNEYLDDTVNAAGETPGAANVHGSPSLGSDVIINELDPFGTGNVDALDRLEIYNPTGGAIDIAGYVISDGDGYCPIANSIIVPAGGFVVLTEDAVGEGMDCTGFDEIEFGSTDVAYLFNSNNVRIDQIGYVGGPSPVEEPDTFQRCGDGEGPNDGYDYDSSGGGGTWVVAPQSLGSGNNCPVAVEGTTWGSLKSMYR